MIAAIAWVLGFAACLIWCLSVAADTSPFFGCGAMFLSFLLFSWLARYVPEPYRSWLANEEPPRGY